MLIRNDRLLCVASMHQSLIDLVPAMVAKGADKDVANHLCGFCLRSFALQLITGIKPLCPLPHHGTPSLAYRQVLQ